MATSAIVEERYQEEPTTASPIQVPAKTKARGKGRSNSKQVQQDIQAEEPAPNAAQEPGVAEQTPANQQEGTSAKSYWTHENGGYSSLSPEHKALCDADYAKWTTKYPVRAKDVSVQQYCAWRQERTAERVAKAAERGAAPADQDVERTASESGAPNEKHWTRQNGGIEKLTEDQKNQALADFQKFEQKNPAAAKEHGFEKYVTFRQDRCAEEFGIGSGLRRAYHYVDGGAVSFADNRHTNAFLTSMYEGKSTGRDALRNLQASVEPGQSRSENVKNMFSLDVERSADNRYLRTTLYPLPGKEAEVKREIDKAARQAFSRCKVEPRTQQREPSHHSNDLGR
ncbi:MAG: hypothetical protein P4L10_03675 [Acidobacteriaceae bacterium]|nr:hypothetical protein [Acidobacteriaceae bacterium]